MMEEERLSDICFQLSSADWRKIIEELLNQELKLNEVAKKLDMTATEAFRQLQRLTDAKLLEKVPDGKYRSTVYAKLVLDPASSLRFLSKNREHLLGRDTSLLPSEFRTRLGDLSDAVLRTETVPNLNNATESFRTAKKRIDLMVEQRLESHGMVIAQKIKEGVKVRFLLQESMLASLPNGPPSGGPFSEVRVLPRVCAMVVIVDDTAGISFPRSDGTMDYALFVGEDPRSVKWASDLFEDQWKKARPLRT